MKKVIFFIVIFLNLPAAAIDYNDFPPNMQQLLDERIAELKSNGGICIAGRVTMSDGAHISGGEDVMVNLYHSVDEPLWVYEDGWFMMGRTLSSDYAGPRKGFVLRAFGYEPNDAFIRILKGEITYVEFVMDKTPSENLASITGIVVDEQNEPFKGAIVRLSFPFADHGNDSMPYMSIVTGPDGQYSFEGLSGGEHSLGASASGYAYHSASVTPPAGETVTKNLKLWHNRKAIIDYVYQANGSRSFSDGNLQKGTIEWVNSNQGVDFSDGEVEGYEPESLRDIEMTQGQDTLNFQIFYCNGKNGFYDAGAVDFDSLTEAPQTTYSLRQRPCVVGHVYIVRTYEDNYAKFIVRSISEE
jgi:hypothetical protein